MYHIPKDRRAARSAQALYEALIRQLGRQPLSEITVQDVTCTAGVGRATFYRRFDNITDIILWKCDEIMASTIAEMRARHCRAFREAFFIFFAKWEANLELLSQLERNNRMELLWALHGKYLDDIQSLFWEPNALTRMEEEFFQGMLAGLIPIGFQIWARHPELGAEELYRQLRRSFGLMKELMDR